MVERLWHEATLEGVAVQPLEGLPILLIQERLNLLGDFSSEQRRLIQTWGEAFYRLFQIRPENGLLMLWRLGHAKPTGVPSLRRDVKTFIR